MTASAAEKAPKQPKSEKPPKQPKEKKEKAPKLELIDFLKGAPAEALSPEGHLNVSNPEAFGYDEEKHEGLKRDAFANDALFATWKAGQLRRRAAELVQKAERLEAEATTAAKFGGDAKKRSQVKRFQKVADSFKALREQLLKDGIDVDSLLGSNGQA